MKRTVTVTVVTGGLLAAAAAPSYASPAQHLSFQEAYDGSEHWAAADNLCGAWAATFREVRSGSYDLLVAAGGQQPGELHVNGAIDGDVTITPDDPTRPTYYGSYREKVNGIVVGTDPATGDDVTRVSSFGLRTPMVGTDGSRLVLVLRGKVTMTPAGDVVVERFSASCE